MKSEAFEDDFINEIKVYSLCDNILLYSDRVVIPKKLQKRILKDFHAGHPGKNRMKSLMRSYVYWPAMDRDISDMIDACRGALWRPKH